MPTSLLNSYKKCELISPSPDYSMIKVKDKGELGRYGEDEGPLKVLLGPEPKVLPRL